MREELLTTMTNIGNGLTEDYVRELELRLNGTFEIDENPNKTANGSATTAMNLAVPTQSVIVPSAQQQRRRQVTGTGMFMSGIVERKEPVIERGVPLPHSHSQLQMQGMQNSGSVSEWVLNDFDSKLENSVNHTNDKSGSGSASGGHHPITADPSTYYDLKKSRTSTVKFSLDFLSRRLSPGSDNREGLGSPRANNEDEPSINGSVIVKRDTIGSMSDIPLMNDMIGGRGGMHNGNDEEFEEEFEEKEFEEEEGDGLDMEDTETKEMLSAMVNLAQQTADAAGVNGSDGVGQMWTRFIAFKQSMKRPPSAARAYKVEDHAFGYIALRDMLDALPSSLAKSIFMEQQSHPSSRIRDVLIQRGCWPIVRFSDDRHVAVTQSVEFNDLLLCIQQYLKLKKGRRLLGVLDPQHTTGYRLHQITAVIRNRNEAQRAITALNFRVGRMWTPKLNIIHEAIDFWSNLDKPASMLFLGPNTAEKAALCRVVTRIVSERARTALVDTRCTVGGYMNAPCECGTAVRFYVNSIDKQPNVIDQTREIYPQVVVVDEVMNEEGIYELSKLQSEGISVIAGTNIATLKALLVHPIFSKLLPSQHQLIGHDKIKKKNVRVLESIMSPHLLVLELNHNASKLRVYKNIPAAVKSIKHQLNPQCEIVNLEWGQFGDVKTFTHTHKREISSAMDMLMQQSLFATSRQGSRNPSPQPAVPRAMIGAMAPTSYVSSSLGAIPSAVDVNSRETSTSETL